jgi:hypothetical protein
MDNVLDSICNVVNLVHLLYHPINEKQNLHLIYAMTPFHKKLNYFRPNTRINEVLINQLTRVPSLRYNFEVFMNPISNINVNSGVTVKNIDEKFITIWRTEEFPKVLIHELIHYYDLEKGTEFNAPWINISNNFPHYSKELFTELQTWYLHIIYLLYSRNYSYNLGDLRFIFDYERTHTLMNFYRVLHHYHITDIRQLLTKNNKYMINVGSSVIYYYLFKAIILFGVNCTTERLLIPTNNNMVEYITHHLSMILKSKQLNDYYQSTYQSQPKLQDTMNMMGLHL